MHKKQNLSQTGMEESVRNFGTFDVRLLLLTMTSPNQLCDVL